jgi:NAD(P)-dependent dehydrogenase (short-subunit alcohol dehydrogenase family)
VDAAQVDKIALVTGGSRGIGAATAQLLASEGFAVAVNYRADDQAANRVVAKIEAASGRAIALRADVSQADEVSELFQRVDEQLGPITALVNNAAILGPRGRVEELRLEDLQQVVAVNVIGLILCSQQAIRRMSTRHGGNGGTIVNVSSGDAYIGAPGDAVHYAASKGAVTSFGIGLAQEVAAEGIRVNTVTPGLTRTDMPYPGAFERGVERIPAGRIGEPGEIAEAIAWLLSDKSSFVAGANLRVAGGKP